MRLNYKELKSKKIKDKTLVLLEVAKTMWAVIVYDIDWNIRYSRCFLTFKKSLTNYQDMKNKLYVGDNIVE